jgi:peptidoglycan lytic transglycosylase
MNFLINLLMRMRNVKTILILVLVSWAGLLLGEESFRQQGEASWYGPGFQGKKTASGERFDTNKLTAAHRTLPFGTEVRVTNTANGRSVTVRINDRGPFIAGRIIDLSRAAAEKLDMLGTGTAEVIIETVSLPPDRGGLKSIQVASFSRIGYAEQLVKDLANRSLKAEIVRAGSYYRVLLPEVEENDLGRILATLKEMGFGNPVVR